MTTSELISVLASRSSGIFVVMLGEANAAKTGDAARCVITVRRGGRQKMKDALDQGLKEFHRRFP
jgi:hypothetical protein